MVVIGGCLLVASQVVSASGSPTAPDRDLANGGTVRETTRSGVSVSLPAGWRVAGAPLVPEFTSPKSVAAFGTFEMPVGGGGECGMYPAKALATMSVDDTLIHVQESRVSAKAKWFKSARHRPQNFDLSKLGTLRRANFLGRWGHRFDFRVGRRYFYVFVAFGSRPDEPVLTAAERILDSFTFSKRSPVPRQLS